ncbi:hypothetical protein Sa4125_38190 [Aureimonas sp. SA4125]|uniref:type II toxin-antitoxin system PemK/MazF family toxin n=1 Tax=Aureimonas sp. SA4125 TaxID=2826993 RepID=UPI001CC4EC7D|nr:type II toxin-antitoxin system PemK/MazF family toxin [Aureimonas sp. SA4125]BDA86277.1 hypothetical protein Sa4125_38190 [Aureimonas sp. SA4125]
MTSFEQGDVVVVPFPYTERDTAYRRPALIVSTKLLGPMRLAWVMMITSADNAPWEGDVHLGAAYADVGLFDPSVVRTAKIANVETVGFQKIGRLPTEPFQRVMAELRSVIGA